MSTHVGIATRGITWKKEGEGSRPCARQSSVCRQKGGRSDARGRYESEDEEKGEIGTPDSHVLIILSV
jgi:hypothetical protein